MHADDSLETGNQYRGRASQSRRIPVALAANGRKLTLALPGPCKLIVEMGGLPPLLVFADPPEQNAPRPDEVTYYFGPGEHDRG